jgi:CelD/BcsL family acetyltransferase involved in cellulose biosynthesis
LLQHLAEQGLTRLDFGRGEERYKRELATGYQSVAEGTFGTSAAEHWAAAVWQRCRQLARGTAERCGLQEPVRWWRSWRMQQQMR